MDYWKKSILWLFLCLVYQGITAQNLTPFEDVTLLKETKFTTTFTGYQPQVIKKSNAKARFTGRKPNYTLIYTPDRAYVGMDTFIVEYRDSPDWFRNKIKYLSYVFHVNASTVDTEQDYYVMSQGDTLYAEVLSNDASSEGDLELRSIPIESNGEVLIIGDSLRFIPYPAYTGVTTIQYQACDGLDVCKYGYVTILVEGSAYVSDTINIAIKENEDIDLPLPLSTFSILDSAKNGTLTLSNTFNLVYVPNEDYSGLDSFMVEETNGDQRLYRANVIKRLDQRTALVDDVSYTEINQEVWIDVQANDVTDNFKTRTITPPGMGTLFYVDSVKKYRYVPPLDIESIEFFEYGLKGGKIDEKATATIYINDGHPDPSSKNHFKTPMNTPLVISYQLPIKGHEFKLKKKPAGRAKVDIYNTDTTFVVKCDTIDGSHYIVFTPGRNFVGDYYFTLEHCVTGTSFCVDVDIKVSTYSPTPGSCYCMDDCVWTGDVNFDGRVDMKDLLPLAHHLGQSGKVRSGASSSWNAQRADNWNQKIDGEIVNLKHADTDGNGKLDAADTIAISDHYQLEHSMVPQLVGPSRKFAWYLVPKFDTVKAGELAVIDVEFGDDQNPIVDMEGVAYTINFSPHVKYDSSTLKVTHHPASFLTSNSPFLAMDKQPKTRRVDVGVARTSGSDASGFGVINTVEFIVEEDLAGFKSNLGIIPITLDLTGAVGISSNGESFALPGTQVTVYIDYGDRKVPFSADRLIVWPNPAQGVFNIHLNGDEEMQSAELYSMDGRMIQSWRYLNPDRHRMVVSRDLRGAFLLRVHTTAGVVTKKIQLLGH